MARGHHHRPEHHPHHEHPVHHMRARGGKAAKLPGEEGKVHTYTADSGGIEEEAEGEERKHGGRMKHHKRAEGGAVKRAHGGAVHHGKHHVSHLHTKESEVHHHHYKKGGAAMKHVEHEGHKTKHRRLDRPGRKRGGGIGATQMPLSTAARTHQAMAHHADNDELEE